MPKARKRKAPVVQTTKTFTASTDAQSCRNTIRQFHVLLKRQTQLEAQNESTVEQTIELTDIKQRIAELGGLEKYQALSVLGQKEERGGGSEKILVGWLRDLDLHLRPAGAQEKLRLLEVGALKPDNYRSCGSWIDCFPMDLHSRHPSILEQDFLTMDMREHTAKWGVVTLSLVLNFVPLPSDRGRMLQMAHAFLVPDGLLFLALPLPCVANSRYLTFEHLKALMQSIGFVECQERWRQNGKMGYWLYRKGPTSATSSFRKKTILRQGQRNNFSIIIT